MIKLVIFDIGGVLVDFTEDMYIHYLHEEVLPDVTERELEKFIMPLIQLMEYGTLSVPELEGMVKKHFGLKSLDLRWVQGYKRVAKPKMREIKLFNQVSEKYRTVLLSNVSYSRFAEMKKSFIRLMDTNEAYTSCDLKERKPCPAIYKYVLDKEGVKPKEAVFIDNQIENVIAAEKAGINAIWYRSHHQLVQDLKKLGIDVK